MPNFELMNRKLNVMLNICKMFLNSLRNSLGLPIPFRIPEMRFIVGSALVFSLYFVTLEATPVGK